MMIINGLEKNNLIIKTIESTHLKFTAENLSIALTVFWFCTSCICSQTFFEMELLIKKAVRAHNGLSEQQGIGTRTV